MTKKIEISTVYNKIVEVLNANNYSGEVMAIKKASAGASTGSETLMTQGAYLVSLKHSNPFVFELVKEQVKEYLEYCHQHGLTIRQ